MGYTKEYTKLDMALVGLQEKYEKLRSKIDALEERDHLTEKQSIRYEELESAAGALEQVIEDLENLMDDVADLEGLI